MAHSPEMLCLRSKDKTAHVEQYPQRCPKAWHPSAFPHRPPIDHLKVESTSCGLEKLAGCWMRTHKTLNNDTLPHRMTSHEIAKPSTSCGSKWWKSLFYAAAKSSRLGLTVREQTEQTVHSLLLIPQLIMSVLRKSKYAFATVALCFKNPVNICKFCLKQSGFCFMQAPFAAPTKRPRAASPWHGKLQAQAACASSICSSRCSRCKCGIFALHSTLSQSMLQVSALLHQWKCTQRHAHGMQGQGQKVHGR